VLLVAVLVIPLSLFVGWALTPTYAAPLLIPYGLYVGYLVHLIPRRTL